MQGRSVMDYLCGRKLAPRRDDRSAGVACRYPDEALLNAIAVERRISCRSRLAPRSLWGQNENPALMGLCQVWQTEPLGHTITLYRFNRAEVDNVDFKSVF